MTTIIIALAAFLAGCALAALVYRIDQPEYAKADHATEWAVFFSSLSALLAWIA